MSTQLPPPLEEPDDEDPPPPDEEPPPPEEDPPPDEPLEPPSPEPMVSVRPEQAASSREVSSRAERRGPKGMMGPPLRAACRVAHRETLGFRGARPSSWHNVACNLRADGSGA